MGHWQYLVDTARGRMGVTDAAAYSAKVGQQLPIAYDGHVRQFE